MPSSTANGDLLEEFEMQDDSEFGPSKKFQKNKGDYREGSQKVVNYGGADNSRYNNQKFPRKNNYEQNQSG